MRRIKYEGGASGDNTDAVWDFLMPPDKDGRSANRSRNLKVQQVSDDEMRISWEQKLNGNWLRTVSRVTQYPPEGFVVEITEGPMAGSKFFNYYSSKEQKERALGTESPQVRKRSNVKPEPIALVLLREVLREDSKAIRSLISKK